MKIETLDIFHILEEMLCYFCPLSTMLAISGFIHNLYYIEMGSFYSLFLQGFYHEMRLLRCFVVCSLNFAYLFVFKRRYEMCYADSFLNKSSLHPLNIEEHIHGKKCILKFLPVVVDKMLSGISVF